jgi:hypothetical protein
MAQLQSLTINDTGSLQLPSGIVSNRPSNTTTVQSFTSTGTTSWTAPTGVTSVEVLVVAGGGGGGPDVGGGGGAGGVIYNSAYPVTPGTSYTVTVGAGGPSFTAGANSVFDRLTAIGGGRGGNWDGGVGGNGGSGGGGGGASTTRTGDGGRGTLGQGFPGGGFGGGPSSFGTFPGSGGGGAGGPGEPGSIAVDGWPKGGNGGPGVFYAITGTPVGYAGGGGGGGGGDPAGTGLGGGASYGGGAGRQRSTGLPGFPGSANTGGGGGGAGGGVGGGAGGSGIVVIRYSRDANNTDASGQLRFNTQLRGLEFYGTNNQWTTTSIDEPIVTNGLLMYLDAAKYDGSSSTWRDLSGFNHNATLFGNNGWTSAGGGQFVYPDVNQITDYISLDASALRKTTTSYTIEFWMKPLAGSFTTYFHSVSDGTNHNYQLFGKSTTGLFNNASASIQIPFLNNESMHFVITRADDGATYYYKNGDFVTESTALGVVSAAADGGWILNQEQDALGGGFQDIQNYRGAFMQVKLYNRALNATEIKQNFNASASRYGVIPKYERHTFPTVTANSIVTEGIEAYYDFGNRLSYPGSGTNVYDLANGNTARLVGGPRFDPSNGGSMLFNGAGQYASCGDFGISKFLSCQFTVNVISNPGSFKGFTGANNAAGGNDYQVGFNLDMAGGATASVTVINLEGVNGPNTNMFTGNIPFGTWFNIAFVINKREAVLYVNGRSQRIVAKSGVNADIQLRDLYFAARPVNGVPQNYSINARFGSYVFYKRELTPFEVVQNYNAMRGRFGI